MDNSILRKKLTVKIRIDARYYCHGGSEMCNLCPRLNTDGEDSVKESEFVYTCSKYQNELPEDIKNFKVTPAVYGENDPKPVFGIYIPPMPSDRIKGEPTNTGYDYF